MVKKVTRKFLLDLANQIYNPETKQFLRLCRGTLQNGPDPSNQERIMHCGLGELYFAMTGLQPELRNVSENDVVDIAVKASPIRGEREKNLKSIKKAIQSLKINQSAKDSFIEQIDEIEADDEQKEDFDDVESKFRNILMGIPDENDRGGVDECNTTTSLRARSRRVAKVLRQAAELLPK